MTVLFWDFDGTLAQSEVLWSGSVHAALKAVDSATPVTPAQIHHLMRCGYPWHTPERDYTQATQEKWWALMEQRFFDCYVQCGVSRNIAQEAAQKVRFIIARPSNYTLYDDALSTLDAARRLGCRNVLLSNNYPELPHILDALGVSPLLDGAVISSLEGYNKPRPELFAIAKRRFPADRSFMIGDNLQADIGGGKAAGMTAVLVHEGFSALADHCFHDLHSVLKLL